MSNNVNADEAFARLLQEQYTAEHNATMKADQELAKQLQFELDTKLKKEPSSSSSSSTNHQLYHSDHKLFDSDLTLAKKLSTTLDESILDEEIPDLHQLFFFFNQKYFKNQLDSVEVKWSTRMTKCAGTCTFKRGLTNHCIVTLSEPLLKFRPKKDMIETLLHEMIHALLFLTNDDIDRDGHGPNFLREAKRISNAANVNITVFHNFHDEVDHYLTHVWQCNGKCQDVPPYFGIVRRSMNRPPQPADDWYKSHQLSCGGTFTKVSGPPPKETSKRKRKVPENTIDKYLTKKTKQ